MIRTHLAKTWRIPDYDFSSWIHVARLNDSPQRNPYPFPPIAFIYPNPTSSSSLAIYQASTSPAGQNLTLSSLLHTPWIFFYVMNAKNEYFPIVFVHFFNVLVPFSPNYCHHLVLYHCHFTLKYRRVFWSSYLRAFQKPHMNTQDSHYHSTILRRIGRMSWLFAVEWRTCTDISITRRSNGAALVCSFMTCMTFFRSDFCECFFTYRTVYIMKTMMLLPRKKVWTHLGKELFFHLINQRIMATVVVTLIVAFLLAMPPQLCICKAIHNDLRPSCLF